MSNTILTSIITILTSGITFVIGAILGTLFDLRIALSLVKYFSWLSLKKKPINISGKWEQIWAIENNQNFPKEIDRHGHTDLKQFKSYCYAEFISKGKTYVIFGCIKDNYFVGDWYDKKDSVGYFGAFHLEICNSGKMKGVWIGHSKTSHKVKSDVWTWNKIN